MSENNLYDLISDLNQDKNPKLVFSRHLSTCVEVANHWFKTANPKGYKEAYFGPVTIYLLKDKIDGKYLGLVEDRGQHDLHWYVLPEYRENGHLSTALKTVILPHLFQDNREFQCVTIDRNQLTKENYNASRKLAEAIGFIYTHEENEKVHYKLTSEGYADQEYIDGELSILTDIRAEEIRSEIKYHFTMLKILQSELEMKLGKTDNVLNIKEELDQVRCNFDCIISDAYMDHQISCT